MTTDGTKLVRPLTSPTKSTGLPIARMSLRRMDISAAVELVDEGVEIPPTERDKIKSIETTEGTAGEGSRVRPGRVSVEGQTARQLRRIAAATAGKTAAQYEKLPYYNKRELRGPRAKNALIWASFLPADLLLYRKPFRGGRGSG